jgi:hypothetical protein
MLIISLVVSTIFFLVTLIAVWRARDPSRVYLTVWLGVPCGYLCVCVLPTYLLHALLTSVAATACWATGAGRRAFAYAAVGSFVASYAFVGVPLAVECWQLSSQNPFESLGARLAYEPARPSPPSNRPAARRDEDDLGTDYWANESAGRRREYGLRDLHAGCVQMFVDAPGFGVTRMRGPSPAAIRRADELREARPLPLPEPSRPDEVPVLSAGDLGLWQPGDPARPSEDVLWSDLRSVHRAGAGAFLNPLGFGYVRDREHVAGFISHRFAEYPPKPVSPHDGGHWRLETLDLVSLLKHPQPVTYISKHLPRMDELRDAPTRPLDDFEAGGLVKLRSGDELVTAQGPHRIRMVGALRAREECLRCHTGDPGDLLGAFSYDLRRDIPAGVSAPQ